MPKLIVVAPTTTQAKDWAMQQGLAHLGADVVVTADPLRLRGIGRETAIVVLDRSMLAQQMDTELSMLAQVGCAVVNVFDRLPNPAASREGAPRFDDHTVFAEAVHRALTFKMNRPGLTVDAHNDRSYVVVEVRDEARDTTQEYEIIVRPKPQIEMPAFTTGEEALAWLEQHTDLLLG